MHNLFRHRGIDIVCFFSEEHIDSLNRGRRYDTKPYGNIIAYFGDRHVERKVQASMKDKSYEVGFKKISIVIY